MALLIRTTARLRTSAESERHKDDEESSPSKRKPKAKTMVSLSPTPTNKTLFADDDDRRAEPMEMSDDSEPWRHMDVRSSEESATSFFRSKRGLACMASIFALFLAAAYALLTTETGHRSRMNGGNNNGNLVAPIQGQAYLTPNEFRDIRTAQSGESVLVTGGLGFIGSHVVDLLLHRGFDVTILDDESNGHNHNKFATELVPHDITVVEELPEFPSGGNEGYFTHVIHLAAAISVAESMMDPGKYEKINYGGSGKVLQWVNAYNNHVSVGDPGKKGADDVGIGPIQKIVAASSAAIYGDPDPSLLPLRESAPYGGLSPYADTKYRMEMLMQKFVEGQNEKQATIPRTSATALRFFNVYGPRQDPSNPYSGVISLFLEKALTGSDITILGDGEMTRDFVYVKDVARAIVLALLQESEDTDAGFAVFNVCTGKSITINTLAAQIKRSMESESAITHLDPRKGDIRESSCNPTGAKEGIGFVSAVSQEGGLEKTANWFRLNDNSRMAKAKGR